MIKAFLDVLLEEEKALDENRNKLTNKAVYLICWMMRYLPELFKSWRMPQIGCFFYMGGCKNRFEALFLKMLGRLPVDVLILDPDRSAAFALEDQLLYQMNFTETLHLQRFPQENTEVRMGTAAYHAERECIRIVDCTATSSIRGRISSISRRCTRRSGFYGTKK